MATPASVAGTICGVHAQVMTAAEISLGLRLPHAGQTAIRAALWDEHSLIKTYGPRGTVHLLAAQDLPLWSAALGALPAGTAPLAPGVRFSPAQVEAVVAAIGDALAESELTADELTAAVVARTGAWAAEQTMPAFGGMWPRWRQVMATAAYRGALCFGSVRGRAVTYTSPRRWLPDFRLADAPDALAAVVRRFLFAYGPATPQQFAQWIGAPRGWAATLFDSLAGALEEVEVEGARAWVVAGDTVAVGAVAGSVLLLPYFDAYVVGCHPRDRLFPGRAAERALAGGQAGNFPVLLVDGVVAGVWHQRRSGRTLRITVEPLVELSPAQRATLEEQVARLGAILDRTPHLTIGPVAVGPHA